MLSNIRVKGYKSLQDVSINLSPFTVFIGQHQAGKSSIFESLSIWSEFVRNYLHEIANGSPNGNLSPLNIISDCISSAGRQNKNGNELTIKVSEGSEYYSLGFYLKDSRFIVESRALGKTESMLHNPHLVKMEVEDEKNISSKLITS